jgi:hypothetical protein
MSALPLKADIGTQSVNVRFVPIADIRLLRPQRGIFGLAAVTSVAEVATSIRS